MTRIKLCGLKRLCDVEYANELLPEYVGFVFAKGSKRYVSPQEAQVLRKHLKKEITAVGVFVDERQEEIVELVHSGIIQAVQLHGGENAEYIRKLRRMVDCIVLQAFQVNSLQDIQVANTSVADYVLLDSGGGTGKVFDWSLLKEMQRPYFLAGGLTPENVGNAVVELKLFAVDASSSLETEGFKDKEKMAAFVNAVRMDLNHIGFHRTCLPHRSM